MAFGAYLMWASESKIAPEFFKSKKAVRQKSVPLDYAKRSAVCIFASSTPLNMFGSETFDSMPGAFEVCSSRWCIAER